jgi:hypothetical protein
VIEEKLKFILSLNFSTFCIGVPILLAVAKNRSRLSSGVAAMNFENSEFIAVLPW